MEKVKLTYQNNSKRKEIDTETLERICQYYENCDETSEALLSIFYYGYEQAKTEHSRQNGHL